MTARDPSDTPAVAHRLSLAITRLRSRLREEAGLHGTGLSISQLAVLRSVVDDGPVTAAWLAADQHVSPQSIAQNLAVLKAAGLVRGKRDPADGRKTLVTAEPSAALLLDTLETSRESYLTRAIDQLVAPGQQREALEWTVDLLERLAAADLAAQPAPTDGRTI
jgi:DNA-binding MarR family transcriptional regulator